MRSSTLATTGDGYVTFSSPSRPSTAVAMRFRAAAGGRAIVAGAGALIVVVVFAAVAFAFIATIGLEPLFFFNAASYFVDRNGILRSIQIGEVRDADFERQFDLISGGS